MGKGRRGEKPRDEEPERMQREQEEQVLIGIQLLSEPKRARVPVKGETEEYEKGGKLSSHAEEKTSERLGGNVSQRKLMASRKR